MAGDRTDGDVGDHRGGVVAEATAIDPPLARALEDVRVLIVGGIPLGVLVAGLGSRLAMFVLRVTSPESVIGLTSDDGFVIGRVTLSGTVNLLMLGAAVGFIGAGAYRLVAPWLIGPTWFRRLTVGVGSAVVVGSMLVHSDGIDFTVLQPNWLAVALFVLLPGLFGLAIGPAVDAVTREGSWADRGRRRWLVPLLLLVLFPLVIPLVAVVAVVLLCWQVGGGADAGGRLRAMPAFGVVIRGLWLLVAAIGLVALVNDVTAIL